MRCSLIATGSEFSCGLSQETNNRFLARLITEHGGEVIIHYLCRDQQGEMEQVIRQALKQSELVVISGGLGPTADDVTRQAVAAVVKQDLVFQPRVWERIQGFFAASDRTCPDNNRVQAMFPAGAEIIPNQLGTADGFRLMNGNKHIMCLPGVPWEMRHVSGALAQVLPLQDRPQAVRVWFSGPGESALDAAAARVLQDFPGFQERYSIRAEYGAFLIRFVVDNRSQKAAALRRLKQVCPQFRLALDHDSLAESLVARAGARQVRIACAESCTGGMLGASITAVPGASQVFSGSLTAYHNDVKHDLLQVGEEVLDRWGAVSEECAAAMARGALRLFGADLALAITGIAGPGGGSREKPVGTVCFALAGRVIAGCSRTRHFKGDRDAIRSFASQYAIRMFLEGLG